MGKTQIPCHCMTYLGLLPCSLMEKVSPSPYLRKACCFDSPRTRIEQGRAPPRYAGQQTVSPANIVEHITANKKHPSRCVGPEEMRTKSTGQAVVPSGRRGWGSHLCMHPLAECLATPVLVGVVSLIRGWEPSGAITHQPQAHCELFSLNTTLCILLHADHLWIRISAPLCRKTTSNRPFHQQSHRLSADSHSFRRCLQRIWNAEASEYARLLQWRLCTLCCSGSRLEEPVRRCGTVK